jgi:YspA, cpYpsA-related SLOG family
MKRRILVTGGRDYQDETVVNRAMLENTRGLDPTEVIVIHGAASGADTLVMKWCYAHGSHAAAVPALWEYYAYGAGPRRNTIMLLLEPHVVLEFPGGPGTQDMRLKALEHGLTVRSYS